MDVLTLTFDAVVALGGIYLFVGLLLHLAEAWQICGAAAIAAPLPNTLLIQQRTPSELERLIAWNQRFGLGYGGEGA